MWYLGLEDLGEIPSGYEKYIWIHEKCFRGIEWSKEHGEKYAIVPRNWETDEELKEVRYYLSDIKGKIIEYAADLLNEYHHSNFDVGQWSILLNEWMLSYLKCFYDKYRKLLKVESMGQDCECDFYNTDKMAVALDFTEYCILSERTSAFSVYQYSELYQEQRHLSHIRARRITEYEKPPVIYNRKTLGYYKVLAYRGLIQLLKKTTRLQDRVVLQESYLPLDFLSECMKKKPGRITNYVFDFNRFERQKIPLEIDSFWRNQKSPLPDTDDEFVSLMCRLLKRNLPIAYVEGFSFLKKRADTLYRFAQKPNAVIFARGGIAYDEVFKIYLMGIRHTKAVFYGVQHGGNYGIERTLGMQTEYETYDYFYTWGWKVKRDFPCKCRPMPAAKLLDKRLEHVENGNKILYVNYVFTAREGSPELSWSKRALFYEKDKAAEIKFFKGLSAALKGEMVVRLFQSDYGWHVKEDLEACVPGLQYDEETDFYSSLGQAKLVVCMAWSTTIMEALRAGKPVLVLHDIGQAEEEAVEDLKELERVGVLTETWQDLAVRLEQVYQRVDVWWNEPERRQVVDKIKEKYAYMPENAREIWIGEIMSLANGVQEENKINE